MQTALQEIAPALEELHKIRNAPTMARLAMLDGALEELGKAMTTMAVRIDAATPYLDEGNGP